MSKGSLPLTYVVALILVIALVVVFLIVTGYIKQLGEQILKLL